MVTMRQLHVGAGITRGALTVFPIWGEFASIGRHAAGVDAVRAVERGDAPDVGRLQVTNTGADPVVLFEGQVLEGGWQNRMLARSFVVAGRGELAVDVVCVEQGRWDGGRAHRVAGRRGSARVRSGLRYGAERQEAVWSRVREYEGMYGATLTASYTEHADRAAERVAGLTEGVRPLPGQIGLLVALAGQPVFAEVFDSHETLLGQFDAIVRAAALDAIGLNAVETPSRRARRFIDRASHVPRRTEAPAGLGRTETGRDQYAEIAALVWQDADVHLVISNPRHELNMVPA
jgi:hypothetical protein